MATIVQFDVVLIRIYVYYWDVTWHIYVVLCGVISLSYGAFICRTTHPLWQSGVRIFSYPVCYSCFYVHQKVIFIQDRKSNIDLSVRHSYLYNNGYDIVWILVSTTRFEMISWQNVSLFPRRRDLERELAQMLWRIVYTDIEPLAGRASSVVRIVCMRL